MAKTRLQLAKVFIVVLLTCLQMAAGSMDKRSTVCYGELGCFSTSGAFTSLARPINLNPQSPAKIGIRFLLFTRNAENVQDATGTGSDQFHEVLDPDDHDGLLNSAFNASRQTKVVIHGLLDDGVSSHVMEMKDELLKHGDYNVVSVDWGDGAGMPYTQATANTRVVGAALAKLLRALQTQMSAEAEDFHLIGHSLGAHVAGYAGERIPNLARISGLDPADPYFQHTDPEVRLDPSDATFVDIVHTNGESILKLGVGMEQACGHLDFYPNGGLTQPGCDKGPIESIIMEGLSEGLNQFFACSHLRAYKYFTESINGECPFIGYACGSYEDFQNGLCLSCKTTGCGYLGFHADMTKTRAGSSLNKFYLDTGADISPFCRHEYQIDVEFGELPGGDTETGTLFVNIVGSKDESGEQQLTPEPIEVEPGHTYHFLLASAHDIGEIMMIHFRWSLDSHWYDPSTWTLITSHSVGIDAIGVVSGETDARKRFCGFATKVNTDTTEMFTESC